MLGQTNKTIRSRRLPQALRRSMTDAERRLWKSLRSRQFAGFKFRRQHPFGPYVLDFVCLSSELVIEVDGGQHAGAEAADAKRTSALANADFRVLRFWNNDVLRDRHTVMERIWRELLEKSNRTPSPP